MALCPAYDNYYDFDFPPNSAARGAHISNLSCSYLPEAFRNFQVDPENEPKLKHFWDWNLKQSLSVHTPDTSNYYATERYLDSLGKYKFFSSHDTPKEGTLASGAPNEYWWSNLYPSAAFGGYPEEEFIRNFGRREPALLNYHARPHVPRRGGRNEQYSPRPSYTSAYHYIPRVRRC